MRSNLITLMALASISFGLASCKSTSTEPSSNESASANQPLAGGQSGYDKSIQAIEPDGSPIPISLAGEQPADISRFLVVSNQAPRSASLSPDGEVIAFVWSITGKRQLWVMPSSGGQPQQLTFGNGITFYRWAKDSNNLIYGADNNGDEQEAYYLISADGKQEKLVLASVTGGFRMFGDYVNDNTVIYSSTERNKLDFDIYQADLTSGKSQQILQGRMGLYVRSASPDGQYVVVSESVGEDSDNLYLLNVDSNELKPISTPTRRAAHSRGGIRWTSDSKGFYLSTNLDSNFSSLRYYTLGQGFKELVTADGDIENINLCGENDRYLLWSINQGGYSKLFMQDNQTMKHAALAEDVDGVISASCNSKANKAVLSINSWKNPGEIQLVDLTSLSEQTLFETNLAGLDVASLIKPESITIEARDGVQLQGLLYLPKKENIKGGKPPVVFSVHGGPTAQSRPSFSPLAQYLLGQGIAVFYPNVRGSTGFGHTYVTLDDQENRLDSIRDLVDMLDYLRKDGRVDADRAVVRGGSYGGYAVNAALANFPGNFIAGISIFGVADWVTALDIASPSLKASDRIEYGDINDPKWRDYYTKYSPIRQADQIKVPVLYSHGAKDPRIDIYETEVMVKTLRENGVRADFVRFLDEGHGWRKFSNQLFYSRQEVEFLHSVFNK